MTLLRAMGFRLYADLLMPSRLDAYRAFLDAMLEAGYLPRSLGAMWRLFESGDIDPDARYLVLRHDVDTDPATAGRMWSIEQERGIAGSFFFRLATVDVELMARIAEGGGEASYHYEELAAVIKARHLRTRAAALAALPEARLRFGENLQALRRRTRLPMEVVASHGDFVNRALGISNHALLEDAGLRSSLGIELEAYDRAFLDRIPERFADGAPPTRWIGGDPRSAAARRAPLVQVLVHPRHWYASRLTNIVDDANRVREGLAFRIPRRQQRPAAPSRSSSPSETPGADAARGPEPTSRDQQPRVAMALYADVTFDSRVQREAASLVDAGYAVTVYCLAGSAPPDARYAVVARRPDATAVLPDGSSPFLSGRPESRLGRIRRRIRWMVGYGRNLRAWGRWAVAEAGEVEVWHAHDLTGLLAVGPLVGQGTSLVYDSHEIFMETGTAARLPGPLRALLGRYERRLARRAASMITVNDSYADVLGRRLAPRRIAIVRNCPPRWSPGDGSAGRLRRRAGIEPEIPLILYHGSFTTNRGIEQLAEAMLHPELAGAHLVLLGFGSSREFLDLLAAEARFGGRIHVLDAVAPSELLAWIADADVDAIPLQRSTLNHWLCTPNKLWESLAAGVPVVVSDFPAMRAIVQDDRLGPFGQICDAADPGSIARALGQILAAPAAERASLRARCRESARLRWNWEHESATLIEVYRSIAGAAAAARR